ncbi:putative peptidoglycan lipid II flippase [Desulfatibacillum alkenivorans DSM 16219]|uniref:Probable lipid II flippase MurJ n=1 Tax=Desulfatibacillum alkenivorans DSM 16219 TaxID=1121393 RepID=A0A1M6KRI8_9BACT|nr:murein biosynthesis integral membrane protein MurJ [Desulfatibacillum alkenivorans]SHJ61541.1 putative peptidoglycan lipid II flippase [Desulfatibacillum alkenivorans DSM 16219]
MSERVQMTKAAGIVGGATAISRVLGYVRDAVMAYFFGTSIALDAFLVAFRIPNLLRRLFAEGSLTIAFVPVFSEYLEKKGHEEAMRMAGAAFRVLALILAGLTVLGVIFAPQVVMVLAPGFAKNPDQFALTVLLTRITFPYIFFIGLVALCMGILNSMRHFAAPALAPIFLNIAMIACVYLFFSTFEPPVISLALGVIIGGALQLALQFPFMHKKGFRGWIKGPLSHPGIKRVAVLMGPAVLGAGVYQVYIIVGTILASMLPEGSVSYLYYADRLTQLPLGIFGISLATAALPSFSRQAANKDMEGLKDSFGYAIRIIMFVNLPATVGLIVLAQPIVGLLFERGAFGAEATLHTAHALIYFVLGLCAISGARIVVSMLYALQDTVTPVRVALLSLVAYLAFSMALMKPLLHGGLALAATLSSALSLALLTYHLRRKIGPLGGRKILKSVMGSLAASMGMGAAVYISAHFAGVLAQGQVGPAQLTLRTMLCIGAGIVVYVGLASVFCKKEFQAMWSLVDKRVKRRG